MTKFLLYSRWREFLNEIQKVYKADRHQVINGEDTLALSTNCVFAKGDRILWQKNNVWNEHVVNELEQEHSGSETFNYICEASYINDLRLDQIHLAVWNNVSAKYALTEILKLTTWSVGEVEDFGNNSIKLENLSAYEALLTVAGIWGGEIVPTITVSDDGVVSGSISLVHQRGTEKAARFEYGYNMTGVRKSILPSDVITACYGYGKTLDTKTDGVPDRLTFSSINGGKPYVEDNEAIKLWGLPDGKGGLKHTFGIFEDYQIETQSELLQKTKEHLSKHNKPEVSYEVDIVYEALNGVSLGDVVQVTDLTFTPEVRLEARIGELTQDVLTEQTAQCVFGTVVSVVPDIYARQFKSFTNYVADYVAENVEDTDSFKDATAQEVFNKLTNNGTVQGISKVGNNIYINASYINSGTLTVGKLLTANKTAGTVTIAGFSVKENVLQGDSIRIGHKGITVESDNASFDIGDLTAVFTGTYSEDRWISLVINDDYRASGAGFAYKTTSTSRGFVLVGGYCQRNTASSGMTNGAWNFFAPLDMHGFQITNANFPSTSAMAIGNSIGDEVSFLAPTKINDDGTIAEYAEVKLEYENGILKRMVRPEVSNE